MAQSGQVTRIQSGLTHIILADQLHSQTFQTDSQSTVRRHTITESIQILLQTFLIHSFCCDLLDQHVVIMDTLTTGGNLQTMIQKVKA